MKSRSQRRHRAPAPTPAARSPQPATAPPGAAPSSPVSTHRKWAFRGVALLTPLLLVGLLELALRLAHFGYPTTFFRPAEIGGRPVLVENDKFAWRFLPPTIARSPAPTVLTPAKAEGTFRIFLFGESAALGDPRPAYGVGRYLETLLRERFPAARFEVICVAMTAINSHAVLPIARECAGLDGDLWVLYLGNNEMAGPFGVLNPFGPRAPALGFVRASLALKTLKTGQWLAGLLDRVRTPNPEAQSWAGMKTMAQHPVPPQDPARETIYRNFERNLQALLETGVRAGLPLLLSAVASNLRECGPFASVSDERLTPADRARWDDLVARAVAAQTHKEFAPAAALYQQALALDPQTADLHFRLGHCWLAQTNAEQARFHFAQARDCDALPFRADHRINSILEAAAQRFSTRGVVWFDAVAVLSAHAPGGSPGGESFFEHVHLNFEGNYRLALALAGEIEKLLPARFRAGQRLAWADPELCARRLGLTDWNRFAVYENVLQRLGDAPFTNQLGHLSRRRALQTRLVELRSALQPYHFMDGRAIYDEALARSPGDFRLHENYAEFLESTAEYAEAAQQWERVRVLIPHHCLPYYHLARMQTRLGQFPNAEANLRQALFLRPDFVEARLELAQSFARQGRPDQAIAEYYSVLRRQPGNPVGLLRLADALATQGQREAATQTLREAAERHPALWEARYFLGVELAVQEQLDEASAQFAEVVRLRPDFPLGHLNYGVALAKLGRVNEAAAHFRLTLTLDPANAKAAEYLHSLESASRTTAPASPTDPELPLP